MRQDGRLNKARGEERWLRQTQPGVATPEVCGLYPNKKKQKKQRKSKQKTQKTTEVKARDKDKSHWICSILLPHCDEKARSPCREWIPKHRWSKLGKGGSKEKKDEGYQMSCPGLCPCSF
jgi:hypothetical protein